MSNDFDDSKELSTENSFDSRIPHSAITFLRQAQSFLYAKDYKKALKYLDAAIDEAIAHGEEFAEAQKARDIIVEMLASNSTTNALPIFGIADETTTKAPPPTSGKRKASIFISYNHNDSEFAKILHNALNEEGIDAWFDELVEFGDDIEKSIAQKHEECDAVIFIMTPQSVSSPTIQAELKTVSELGKKIYPLLLKDVEENPFPNLRYVDARGGKLPPERFYQQLRSINIHSRLAGDTSTEAPPPVINKKKKGK